MKIDPQIYYWAHMLDEAFEKDCKIRELSQSEVSECIRNGLPSKMKAYDIVECRANGFDCLIAGWKDFPSGWFCVINMYSLDQNGKWIILDKRKIACSQNEFDECMYEIINELGKKFKPWIPVRSYITDPSLTLNKMFNDIEWDPDLHLNGTDYDSKYCNFKNIDVNGISFANIGQNDNGDVMYLYWYQKKGLDSAPIEKLLTQKIKNDIDSQKKAMSKSFFTAWQQEPGNSIDSICKQIGKKLDKKIEQVFGIQNVVKLACSVIRSFIDDERLRSEYDAASILQKKLDVSKLVDRRFWWDLIPDQVYRAVVSRAAHPEKSRGVSLKTIRECISKICFDVSQLYVQSMPDKRDICLANSQTVSLMIDNFSGDAKAKFLVNEISNEIGRMLLNGAGSYVDRQTFSRDVEYYQGEDEYCAIGDSCEYQTYGSIFAQLKKIRADETDEQFLIAQISKIIDRVHNRGSLAGVFIEGGAKTCQEVSSMKPDEMYESA